jgi:hypothetical protein
MINVNTGSYNLSASTLCVWSISGKSTSVFIEGSYTRSSTTLNSHASSYRSISEPKAEKLRLFVAPYTVMTSVAESVIPSVKVVESLSPTAMS